MGLSDGTNTDGERPLQVAVSGVERHGFTSVNQLVGFYLRALGEHFDAVVVGPDDELGPDVDLVVNLGSRRWWREDQRPACPIMFVMFGGPVLDPRIRASMGHLRTTDVLVGTCRADEEILASWFDGPAPLVRRIEPPVDLGVFRPRPQARCRAALGFPADDLIVGFAGRFIPQKNLHQYCRMLARAREAVPGHRVRGLAIGTFWTQYPVLDYGADRYPDHISELITELDLSPDLAITEGDVNPVSMAVGYGAMDVLVHPTNTIDENFGYVPIEAASCGTPTVGAAYGGLRDSVIDGLTGVAVPTWATPGGIRMDVEGALDGLVALLADADQRRKLGVGAMKRARRRYDERRCAQRLVSTARHAVAAHRGSTAEPVSPRPAPSPPTSPSSLPSTEPPFEYYLEGITRYVSGPAPVVGAGSRLRLAAPLTADGERHRLADPAWPASFLLDPTDQEIVERTTVEQPAEVLLASGVSRSALQRRVDDGLLLCSNR